MQGSRWFYASIYQPALRFDTSGPTRQHVRWRDDGIWLILRIKQPWRKLIRQLLFENIISGRYSQLPTCLHTSPQPAVKTGRPHLEVQLWKAKVSLQIGLQFKIPESSGSFKNSECAKIKSLKYKPLPPKNIHFGCFKTPTGN